MPKQKEKMDVYFAVFDCHVNNALEEASRKFKEVYNKHRFEKCIKPYIDKGIMSIFKDNPTRSTKFFVFYIQRVVNSNRI